MAQRAPSKAIINLTAYRNNLDEVRRRIPDGCRIAAVVKTDAYGHGMVPIALAAQTHNVGMIAVATIHEGVTLREEGITIPILVMIELDADNVAEAVQYDLAMMVSDIELAERIGEQARKQHRVASIHCKIDTGMGRQGFDLDSASDALHFLTRISHVDIDGIATHFPVADRADDPATPNQIRAFKQFIHVVDKRGIPYDTLHASNSAAIINFPQAAFDMVRPGIMTYGVWPCGERPDDCPLEPVLRWETKVRLLRTMRAGATIGYGHTFTASTTFRAALLPVGYGDGYMHALGNRAHVLIHGRRCPVRGAISMDQILVDVSTVPNIEVGDTATIIGTDGEETITAEELAHHAETIPYEILARIGNRVHREYVD